MSLASQSIYELLLELIKIPGVTASKKEDLTARFIYERLAELNWFKKNPQYLELLSTPLERDQRQLHSVCALVLSAKPTRDTIILTGHYDVVDTAAYGELEKEAFNPQNLASCLRSVELPREAAADLASGKFLFGRGSMDMKCGLAVEIEILREFAENRELFDANILFLAVPDEENASAGMRGAVSWLNALQEEKGLNFLAAINTEPTDAGRPNAANPTVFLGTVGKLMPVFLCLGQESHVGAYYDGVNAALLSARILELAENNPDLADPAQGECCPSWICLEHKILREHYSVTVPGEAVVYFNCFTTQNTPAVVLKQMREIAWQAASETIARIAQSQKALNKLGLPKSREGDRTIPVFSFEEMLNMAQENRGAAFQQTLNEYMETLDIADPREASIAIMRKIASLAGKDGPLVLYGFLPPFYPARTAMHSGEKNESLQRAVNTMVEEAASSRQIKIDIAPFFTGICDLSYFGFQGTPEELEALQKNMPGWGKIYSVPVKALNKLNIPIVNFGPSGRDAHKKTERLEMGFSLGEYPEMLKALIREVMAENRKS